MMIYSTRCCSPGVGSFQTFRPVLSASSAALVAICETQFLEMRF
jgi:hypothetical protein